MKVEVVCRLSFVICLTVGIAACTATKSDYGKVPALGDRTPPYQTFKWDKNAYVPFDANTTVTLDCPDPAAAEWLQSHYNEWYGDQAPKVTGGRVSSRAAADGDVRPPAGDGSAASPKAAAGDESYAATVDETGVKIAANTLAGTRLASYTMRQLAIAKRGTFKRDGLLLPKFTIEDRPHIAFRAVHLCCFPETSIRQIERAIRLAALLKFNYAIIEPWGTYKSEKNPWWSWPNAHLTKSEVKRLVAVGRDLGITLIPQINCYGHASASRGGSIKHCVLDLHPEYAPLYEPAPLYPVRGTYNWDGWSWCISNPEAQRVIRELIAEMHEDFGNPPFFHIGCDEAFGAQTCPECVKHPKDELLLKHLTGISEFVKSRGARAMMWHDMLLEKSDRRWDGFIKFGSKETAAIIDRLPRDIIICDWQYWDKTKGKDGKDWPTISYFAEKGFSVAGCPWMNYKAMRPMADHIAKAGAFGYILTTWHHLRGSDWENMYKRGAFSAWGSPVSHDVSFQRSLRLIGNDMKVKDYDDSGFLNNQVPPSWWISN